MFVTFFYKEGTSIIELSKFCGVAPCQILAVNKCGEQELLGRTIDLPVSTPVMIRAIPWFYVVGEDGRLYVKNIK